MSEAFLGEIRMMAFNYPPKGWALCNGQLLPINQNQALFALLGTTYGGNGQTNFALPNLQGRAPIHKGNGFNQGQIGGAASHTLTLAEMPMHGHAVRTSAAPADQSSPANNVFAQASSNAFTQIPSASMAPQCVSAIGGSQPHENQSPYLVISFCIALQGIFPSQN